MVDKMYPEVSSIASPGTLCRQQREKNGWSLQDIAQALYLPVRRIEAIEQDDYAALPGPTYVQGYWRNYAGLLEITIEDSIAAHKSNLMHSAAVVPRKQPVRRWHSGKDGGRRRIAVLFSLLLVFLLAAAWYWQTQNTPLVDQAVQQMSRWFQRGEPAPATGSEQQPADPVLPVPNFPDDGGPPAPAIEPPDQGRVDSLDDGAVSDLRAVSADRSNGGAPSVANEELPDAADSDAPAINPTGLDAAAATATAANAPQFGQKQSEVGTDMLHLRLAQSTWLEVRDQGGSKLIDQTVPGDEYVRLRGRPPFYVFIADAAGAEVTYRGQPVPIAISPGSRSARFQVGEN